MGMNWYRIGCFMQSLGCLKQGALLPVYCNYCFGIEEYRKTTTASLFSNAKYKVFG